MRRRAFGMLLIFLPPVLIGVCNPLRADVTGTILGNVTDSTEAAVPGARVILRNPKTGLTRNATTDTAGSYEFLAVPVGEDYKVEVEAQGFRRSSLSGITLLVNQSYRGDFRLTVGSLAQAVDVSAQAVQVETTSTQLGTVIESHTMTALPLNGRSYTDLLSLQAGVIPLSSSVAPSELSGSPGLGVMSVNGSREAANSFLVNGGDVEESRTNGTTIVPTLDSIQEFRLLTNTFDAEYGKFSGAVVNVITKSGTNELHGSVFEFLRNDKLDSRNFFDQNKSDILTGNELPGTARGIFKRNQFGGTLGGRILKDRLFFFGDYQGTREGRGASSGQIVVPSSSERTGDFSDVGTRGLPSLTGTVRGDNAVGDFAQTLSQRLGYTVSAGEPYWVSGCTTMAQAQAGMCVFPGQVIPSSAFSPAAKGTLQFIPLPVVFPNGTPTYSTSALVRRIRDDKFGQRVDLNTSRTGTWSFSYHFDDSRVLDPGSTPGFGTLTPQRAQQVNIHNTHSFGASAVNELMLNYTRLSYFTGIPQGGLGKVSSFGFVEGGLGLVPGSPEGVPLVIFAGAYGPAFGVGGTLARADNTAQISDNFSKILGKHTAKIGGDTRYFQINSRYSQQPDGLFVFVGGETGNGFADYLLGAPDAFVQGSLALQNSRTKYFGLYGQDSFKLRPNVTLNYGMRWEASEPYYETQNLIQAFVPGLQSKIFPDAPRGWVFPGDPGVPRTLSPTRWNNLAPRAGIAYSPGFSDGVLGKIFGGPGKTSIRAGFGMYYTSFEQISTVFEIGDPPFGLFYSSPTLIYMEQPFKDRQFHNDPGQRFPSPIKVPGTPNVDFSPYQPITSSQIWQGNNVLPYVEHLNFNVGRQIGNSTILSLSFVGSRGHHLITQVESNPGSPARCLQIHALYAAAKQAGGCGPGGEDSIYTINGETFYGTRPYSVTSGRHLSQGLLDFAWNPSENTMANSNYNSLQASLEKRAGPLNFLGAYTWSKSLDNSSGFLDLINPYNYQLSKSLSTFDMTHNFVVSYSYNLPFQHLAKSSTGAVRKLVEGWTAAGITRFTTGQPVTITQSGDWALTGSSTSYGGFTDVDKPNYSGAPIQFHDPRTSANHQFFSTGPFSPEQGLDPSNPILGVAGNANRRFFHGPGLNNWDFALLKSTRITERTTLEFRAEFFNIFNHSQFFFPSPQDFNSATFGDVTNARDPRIGQVALKLNF